MQSGLKQHNVIDVGAWRAMPLLIQDIGYLQDELLIRYSTDCEPATTVSQLADSATSHVVKQKINFSF